MQTEMKVNVSTYPEIRNWAKSKLGNRGPGERLSWGKRDKGQRKARTCVASLRAQVAAARAEKCECARPHTRSRLHQQLVAALLHLQLGRQDRRWARGREGQAWAVGCVCPARPHTPAWKGEGAVHTHVSCRISLSSQPHTPPARGHSRPVTPPQPGRSGVLAPGTGPHTSQQLDAWFLLLGVSPSSTCTYTCKHSHVPTRVHTDPRVPPHTPRVHTCLCARKQPTDVHTHVCPHMHASVLTPALVTALAFRPQPGACPPAGLRPPQHPPWAHPNPVFLPPRPWRVFLCHCWCCRLWVGPWCPGRLCGLWCLGQRGARLSARG